MITSQKLELKNIEEWVDVPFHLERPFLKVVECYAVGQSDFEPNFQFTLTLETHYANGEVSTNSRRVHASKQLRSFPFSEFPVDLDGAKLFRIKYDLDETKEAVKSVFFEYEPMEYLEMTFPGDKFGAHIKNPKNTKILFSAPYGQGKSTFLDVYFKTKFNEYNVFKVFPVNYSVASNEDIFRYIKSDLLCQLLLKGVQFDINEISYSEAFLKQVTADPVKFFAPFLQSIPKVGKQVYEVFESVRKNVEQSDQRDAEKFVEDVYEQEGGIYEDNFYTQLIRHLLLKHRTIQGGENVLIIDDLDRMDPDHIFRILNVISAHYDTYRLLEDQDHNKFGFDKIVVVCDLENIRHIFQHRYGPKTDFTGYINKFYSTEKFEFNNKEVYIELINSFKQDNTVSPGYQTIFNCFSFISRCFIEANQLSLREILKMKSFKFWDQIKEVKRALENRDVPHFTNCAFAPSLFLFSKMVNTEDMIRRFELCKHYEFEFGAKDWHNLASMAIIGVAEGKGDKNLKYRLDDGVVGISIDFDSYCQNKGMDFTPYETMKASSFSKTFTQEDFFGFLIENVSRLQQLS